MSRFCPPGYVSGMSIPDDWEHPQSVAERCDAGVCDRPGASSDTVVIASHGMAMTTRMVILGLVEADQARGAFCASLTF